MHVLVLRRSPYLMTDVLGLLNCFNFLMLMLGGIDVDISIIRIYW